MAPVSRTTIVFGKIFGSATISMFNGILILIIAILLGAIPLAHLGILPVLLAIVFMALICFAFVALGIAIASKLNNMEGFQMIMSFLVMPLFFLSGAFFPMTNVPIWMKGLAFIDPLYYGVDGLRGALIGISEMPLLLDIGVLLAFNIAMLLLASHLFSKIGE